MKVQIFDNKKFVLEWRYTGPVNAEPGLQVYKGAWVPAHKRYKSVKKARAVYRSKRLSDFRWKEHTSGHFDYRIRDIQNQEKYPVTKGGEVITVGNIIPIYVLKNIREKRFLERERTP